MDKKNYTHEEMVTLLSGGSLEDIRERNRIKRTNWDTHSPGTGITSSDIREFFINIGR